MLTVGVIGLGNLGMPYALKLLESGYEVVGVDLEEQAMARLEAAGGRRAPSAAVAAQASDMLVLSLPSADAFRQVTVGSGGLREAVTPGQIVVDTSTLAIDDKLAAREALAAVGGILIDATVSGTPESIEEGRLALYASGDVEAFETVKAVLACFAGRVRFVGSFGDASKVKFICNLLVTINNIATAEAMAFAECAGLEAGLVHDLVSEGIASSRIWELRGAMMVEGDYREGASGYVVLDKDGPLIEQLGRDAGAFLPLYQMAKQLHLAGKNLGLAGRDTSSLIELYRLLGAGA